MALAKFQDQKILLQISLITEDEARAYNVAFYQIERILTALDLIATFFLLIFDFLDFVRQDLNQKHINFTAAWELGYFRAYLVTYVLGLLVVEVTCGNILYGHRSY